MFERKVLRGIRSEWRAAEQTPQFKMKIKPEQNKGNRQRCTVPFIMYHLWSAAAWQ